MNTHIGVFIAQKRKSLGYTQQKLADSLGVSYQAVSKWENGSTLPDVALLPQIAGILQTSLDALLGYPAVPATHYEEKYACTPYYWGTAPNVLCYDVMKLRPPVRPQSVLDMGCGEGKDAVFLARNGYTVSAFDIAHAGIAKARELARQNRVAVSFFLADINDYAPDDTFDVVFSSGVLHYLSRDRRKEFFTRLKLYTAPGGIHVLNVFVQKPFIPSAPDMEEAEKLADPWVSGELATYYHDWRFHRFEETIFSCRSGGIPHQHCMNILIAEKPSK